MRDYKYSYGKHAVNPGKRGALMQYWGGKMAEHEIADAFKGRILWAALKRKYGKGGEGQKYIIFASDNPACNIWGVAMLRDYIEANGLSRTVVLAKDRKIIELVQGMKIHNLRYGILKPRQMTQLMRYYALMDKSDVWTVVSVKEPYDTGAERMVGKKGVTYKEIVFYDVYGFSDMEKDIDMEQQWIGRVEKYLLEEGEAVGEGE